MTASTLTGTGPRPSPPASSDWRTISLIGLAHGCSHFFHLLLPPLFPAFIRDFGLSYSELGLLVTVFFVISGVGQALAGFLVDRVGARPVLFTALLCFVGAGLAASLAQGWAGLVLAASLAGVGNAPFHPADFTILNKRVSAPRLGHAFSVHGISGNLGWAAAPVFLLGLTELTGNWRIAVAMASGLAATVLLLLVSQRDAIDDRAGSWGHDSGHEPAAGKPAGAKGAAPVAEHPMAFLKLPSVWLCFSFFFWTSASLSAIQSFASPALRQLHGLPLTITGFVVTGYMLCGAVGMVLGGFLVARGEKLERTISWAIVGSAACLLVASGGWLPGMATAALVALAGTGTGLAGPSRDMLIKRAAPPGATGRVYGTVYSGLDSGFAVAAPILGWMMDQGAAAGIFQASALALLMAVVSARLVAWRLPSRAALPARA